MKKYNGWENWETWNVALWICNDRGLYNSALDYIAARKKMAAEEEKSPIISYTGYLRFSGLEKACTGDNVKYLDPAICRKELTTMLQEMAQEVTQ